MLQFFKKTDRYRTIIRLPQSLTLLCNDKIATVADAPCDDTRKGITSETKRSVGIRSPCHCERNEVERGNLRKEIAAVADAPSQ